MTAGELLAKAKGLGALAAPRAAAAWRWAWSHRTLVLAVLVLLLSLLTIRACGRAAVAEGAAAAATARADQEAAMRQTAVAPVIQVVTQRIVDEAAAAALAEVPELREAKQRLEAQVGKLRTILAVRGETTPGPAHGTERPGEPPAAAGAPAGPKVLLRDGDQLKLSLLGSEEEGDAGARALLVSIGVTRMADGLQLHRGSLAVPVTTVVAAPPAPCLEAPTGRAWRLGPGGGVTDRGWVAGGAYARHLDLWGYKPEAVVTAAGGPGGFFLFTTGLF